MSPGMAVEKYVLSISDLETNSPDVHAYPSQDIIKAYSSGGDGFNANIVHPKTGKTEKVLNLICFGCKEVSDSRNIQNHFFSQTGRIMFMFMLRRFKVC